MFIETQLKTYFAQLAKWQKIVGVFFAISVALLVLIGLGIVIFGGKAGSEVTEQFGGAIGFQAVGILYVLLGLLYFFPTKYLLTSAKKIKAWVLSDDEATLTEGVMNSKSFFKFTGILCIISFALIAVAILAVIVVAIVATVSGSLS